MSDDVKEQMIANLKTQRVRKGQMIVKQGGMGDCMYFLNEGTTEIFINGAKLPFQIKAPDFFGERALMYDEQQRSASIKAATDCELLVLGIKPFRKILDNNPDFKTQIDAKMDKYVFAKQQTQSLTVVFVVGGPACGKQSQCMSLHQSDPAHYPLISMREVLDDKDQLAAANVASKLGQVILRRRARKAKERESKRLAGGASPGAGQQAHIQQDQDEKGEDKELPVGMGELDAVTRKDMNGRGGSRLREQRNEGLLLSAIRALLSGRAPVLPTPRCVLIEGFPLPKPPRRKRGVDDLDLEMAQVRRLARDKHFLVFLTYSLTRPSVRFRPHFSTSQRSGRRRALPRPRDAGAQAQAAAAAEGDGRARRHDAHGCSPLRFPALPRVHAAHAVGAAGLRGHLARGRALLPPAHAARAARAQLREQLVPRLGRRRVHRGGI
jgi:CRP-like cAMP-binding protein